MRSRGTVGALARRPSFLAPWEGQVAPTVTPLSLAIEAVS
jgi:hypothetical protein